MSSDTNVEVASPRAGIYLKPERLTLYAVALNLTNNAAISEAIGVAERTVKRSMEGDVVGEKFIAAMLRGFGEHKATLARWGLTVQFEDLFEVRDKAGAS